MSYLLFAWVASLLYSGNAILAKLTSKHALPNPYLLNFVWSLLFLIFCLFLLPFYPLTWPTQWPSLLLVTFLWALTGVLFVVLLAAMDISALSPLFSLRTGLSVLLGVLLLGEQLTVTQYLLVTLIFIFGLVVNLDERFRLRALVKPITVLALGYMLLLAFYGAALKVAIAQNGYWAVFYWTTFLSQFLLLLTVPLFHREVAKITQKQLLTVALLALVSLVANLAANKAFAENISLSSAIVSLPISMVFAFLFSVFAPELLEKHPLKVYAVRFTAAAVMFLAALQLSS